MSDSKILTSQEVGEIEARALQVKELVGVGQFGTDMLALCATVRHLLEENQRLKEEMKQIERGDFDWKRSRP